MAKTTPKHFAIFKQECEKWIEIFGIKDYEFHFEHSNYPGEDSVGMCRRNCISRISRLILSDKWPEDSMIDLTDENVRLTAFEEVCHVFLYGLKSCARARFLTEEMIDESEHAIIKILQNVLYPKY